MTTKPEPDDPKDGVRGQLMPWETLKLPGERPLRFQSPAELQRAVEAYFQQPGRKSVMGLCVYLDCERRTLLHYSRHDAFFDVFARARDRIQKYYEELAQDEPRLRHLADRMLTRTGWPCDEEPPSGQTDRLGIMLQMINGSRLLPGGKTGPCLADFFKTKPSVNMGNLSATENGPQPGNP